jgi:uncharacterized membrane protein HdeD (DUF308 family)
MTTVFWREVHMARERGTVPSHWWGLGLRGLAAVVFGVLALALPGMTLAVLVLLFGAYAVVDGILAIVSAFRSGNDQLWYLLLEGVVGILAGIAAFTWPGLTAVTLSFIVAGWVIVTGLLKLFLAVRLRKVIGREWGWLISGALSVVFGLVLLAQPGAGALVLVQLIGIFAIIFGFTLFGLAWQVREQEHRHAPTGGAGLHQPVAS